jgi:phosphoglycolate phosphatase-like HAD superfamily hydrolase
VNVEHLVWDWNGTLLADGGALIEATVDAFQECALPAVTREDYQRHHVQPIPLFYERLAGRGLSAAEQERLDSCFRVAYARHRAAVGLALDAVTALTDWSAAGGRQSLLSMYPHRDLVPLVEGAGIAGFFTRIDGSAGTDVARKAPHLKRHLREQGLRPDRTILIGDSLDDVWAARECGVRCLVYHAGPNALHARDHFADAGVPLMPSLTAAVEHAKGLRGSA